MSPFGEMNKAKDAVLVGNEGPFYNSCSVVTAMVDLIPGSPLIWGRLLFV